MKKKLFVLGSLVLAFFSALANPADSVRIKGIPYPCSWINTPQSFNVAADSLSITAAQGSDFYNYPGGNYNIATAPILAFKPDENFVLTAKIKVDFKKTYDGGAIYVMVDSTQYIKFLFENSHYGKLAVCSGVTNTYTDDSNNAVTGKNEVYFRLAKSGNMFGLFYSLEGKNWEAVRLVNFVPKAPIKIGFSSQSPLGDNCTSTFSEIVYTPGVFKDAKTGGM
ncbi:DUF1349 domain-containing protein [Chitinophaga varians]|uniref:DUF1349 domain-containing protein n=1 Tax=Chitinophaga varians TaxID=2202339 RepID=A0A847RML0_9BACT|nr:DUF1349 domain-containing protein [Chitinophaga varians]NLR62844.1 DUF1349 domain-containing protein [Chitinophaga varians]